MGDGVPEAPPGRDVRDFLRRAGPVGRDLLAVDWNATPLGPPETWPRSLRTVVQAMLASRFAMWMAWGEGMTFFCNDAYRRDTLGKKYPWALGRPASEVWAEIWDDIGPRIDAVVNRGEATWDEALQLFLERSGFPEETYHTFSYSPLPGDDGSIAGMLCVVSEDTERVVAERRMSTLRDLGSDPTAVRTQEQVLATASRHLAGNPYSLPFTLTYLFDADGLHARLVATSGVEPGHPIAVPVVAPGDASPWPVADLEDGASIVVDLAPTEPPLPTGAWELAPVQALLAPLPQQGQVRPYGFLVVGLNPYRPLDAAYRDFVGLIAGQIAASLGSARVYEAERERAEQLAELDRAKTAFFTNVSHELRTPLTLLLAPAEDALADQQEPLPPGQRRRMEVVHRNAQRLLKLVNSLLDFNRLQSGRAGANFEPVDLARYTSELASMFESAVDRAKLDLRLEAEPLPELVHVDREGWAHIVLNLVSNALKFTFDGAIVVRVSAVDGRARLEVTDTGIGIEAAEQQKLFERFHRVSGAHARTHEGSGIGLALVAELAALHGGEARVTSTPGKGSTFVVEVPFGTAHLPPEQLAPAATDDTAIGRQAESFVSEALRWLDPDATAVREHAPAGRARVLVADDNADMRTYVADLLADRYDVQTAPDGAVALELARHRPPDLVLTDVMMPNLDGFGLLAALREDPATVHVPVIMLSARAGEDGTIEGLEAGADDYLAKPFAARELLARVRANLELERVRSTRDQLRRSQALLDQAQRLAAVGSWELDLRSGSIVASDEFVRQLDVTRDQLRDQGFERLMAHVHPDDRELVRAAIERATLHGEPIDLQLRLRFGDEVRHFRTIGEVERDQDGRPARLRGSNQDVTEQRAAQQALATVAAEREAAEREHQIAVQLQRSLLPDLAFDPGRLHVASFYRPGVVGTRVGGDWYDLVDLGDDDHTAVVIGDVMGRGVRAAAVMGQLRATVRAYARLGLGPAALLEQLDGVVRDLGGEQIVTCVYGVHEASTRTFTYANAGHLPPLLHEPGRLPRRLSGAAGPLLGSGPLPLQEERVDLPPGSRLVLYTDGLVERRDRPIDDGIDRLADLLATLPAGVAGLPERLVERLAPGGGDDDVAVLVAGPPLRTTPLEVEQVIGEGAQPVRAARTLAAETLAEWRGPEPIASDAVLLVSEMVTNAIVHGEPPIRLRLRRDPAAGLAIEVDDGARVEPKPMQPTPDDEHGRGLQLVAMLAGRWGTRPTAEGKTVWCHIALE